MPATDLAYLYDPAPRGRLLSNGRYRVLLTGAGTGFSAWRDTQLTGWEGDRVEDGDGLFIYLRDVDRAEELWSVGAQPCGVPAGARYTAHADAGGVVMTHELGELAAIAAVCVPPDCDVELRRLTLHNRSARARQVQLTAYAPIVLNQPAAHAAHPAFSKLFVETEWNAERGALLARRRPRSASEQPPAMAAALLGARGVSWETNRALFLGRNRLGAQPRGCEPGADLSGAVGSVLDPAFVLRENIALGPGESATRDLVVGAAESREALLNVFDAIASPERRAAAAAEAAAAERHLRERLGLDAARAEQLQDLAVGIAYQHPHLSGAAEIRRRAAGAMSQLWAHALGGRPLALLLAGADAALQREALAAHAYWTALGAGIDLLIVCADARGAEVAAAMAARQPGVVVRSLEQLSDGALEVALAYASLVADGALPRLTWGAQANGASAPGRLAARPPAAAGSIPLRGDGSLHFDNGFGGFTADGREYAIRVGGDGDERPPLAWTNVIANESCGFLATESGAGYTWSRNSREHRLTPWYNDPVADPHGEALYLRVEGRGGAFWSPQPGPAPAPGARYEVRHGLGFSRWRVRAYGLEQDVVQFVPRSDSIKITRVRVTNTSDRPLRLSAFTYARVVLGVTTRESARFVVTERDVSGALVATNRVAGEFSDGEMFAAALAPAGGTVHATADRAAFIGRGRSPAAPVAMSAADALDGATGVGLDPCLALQVVFEIAAGQTADCVFLLGDAIDRAGVRHMLAKYGSGVAVEAALEEVCAFWRALVGAVQVRTPAPAIDLMVNGWLLYQVLSCRLWARSALYQSGGAYGFRDQLQDALALVYARPDFTRAQLLLHAAHQFVEGDVLHWWHPPLARGIRTRFSDDLLWLPYVTATYIGITGDIGVLEESVEFLRTRSLEPGEDEAYLLPERSGERASLYEHCCRAIDRSLTSGPHGLPLMGTGDWNDGMNRVGREGRGESVWVGFFLYDLIGAFVPFCVERGDRRAERYTEYRAALHAALNDAGWDGAWYRRAYYDDGTPLGSAVNAECRIDALAQAWAVISGAASPERARQAMDAAERQLVDREAGLIRLLTPPFDRGVHDPGYIKGYVPGIRENGGQYTHGAMWVVQAEAQLGRRDRAAAYLEMLSPVSHAGSRARAALYEVEPYVVAADIYGVEPHRGRGGWTWYTGSAGWMYRIALESVLGIRIERGAELVIHPRVPDEWPGFAVELTLHDGSARYQIEVENPRGSASQVVSISVDGAPGRIEDGVARVALLKDRALHRVAVVLGSTC
ncbi:MAG: glycosyl transferase [Candidatus Binatia bacterium]